MSRRVFRPPPGALAGSTVPPYNRPVMLLVLAVATYFAGIVLHWVE